MPDRDPYQERLRAAARALPDEPVRWERVLRGARRRRLLHALGLLASAIAIGATVAGLVLAGKRAVDPTFAPFGILGTGSPVVLAIFSPDGGLLASAGEDGTMRLWNVVARRQEAVLGKLPRPAEAMAFTPDGRQLIVASRDGTLRFWNVPRARLARAQRGAGAFAAVAVAPGGRIAALARLDGVVGLMDIRTGRILGLRGVAGGPIGSMTFGTPGVLAVGTALGHVALLEVARERVRALGRHDGPVHALAFAGAMLASAGDDGKVMLWSLPSGRPAHTLRGHRGAVLGVALAPSGDRLASAGIDGTVRIWDVENRRQVTALRGHSGAVLGVAYSPDARTLASVGVDGDIRLWDARARLVD